MTSLIKLIVVGCQVVEGRGLVLACSLKPKSTPGAPYPQVLLATKMLDLSFKIHSIQSSLTNSDHFKKLKPKSTPIKIEITKISITLLLNHASGPASFQFSCL